MRKTLEDRLEALCRKFGYAPYKMSRFEEYDLYVRNKDFLVSDQIITFSGSQGKLLALKPDVTLSIVKNAPDTPGVVQKVYYNENVYRDYREILQAGLECVGDLGDYEIAEVALLAAIGRDPGPGVLDPSDAQELVFGYAIGLDLTRRDLQAQAKAGGLPWDIAKGFDHSAPVSELVRAAEAGDLESRTLSLEVNGSLRQSSQLGRMIWNVAEILHELSQLYRLRAGDLVFMGTPAGVAALEPGDRCTARLDDLLRLDCAILPPLT